MDIESEGAAMLAKSPGVRPSVQHQMSQEAHKLELKFFSRNIEHLHPTAWDHDSRIGKLRYNVHEVSSSNFNIRISHFDSNLA